MLEHSSGDWPGNKGLTLQVDDVGIDSGTAKRAFHYLLSAGGWIASTATFATLAGLAWQYTRVLLLRLALTLYDLFRILSVVHAG